MSSKLSTRITESTAHETHLRSGLGSSCALAVLLLATSLLIGCVNQDKWRPTTDPKNDANAATLATDEVDCREIAKNSVGGSTTKETAKGAAVGAGVGAAAGAVIGVMAGSPGAGAAAGAAVGGAAGGTYKNVEASREFKTIFKNCMKERGHTVLDED